MTAPALLRQLAQPAQDAYQNTVTVTVPTRLLTALADQLQAAEKVPQPAGNGHLGYLPDWVSEQLHDALAEVERAAKEHTSQ